MLEGNVYIDSMELLTLESFPPQFRLHITGSTPTPCHQLRVAVEEPNDVGKILVKIYSVSDPQAICIQVLAPFDISIPINVGVAGTFTVIANGQDLGIYLLCWMDNLKFNHPASFKVNCCQLCPSALWYTSRTDLEIINYPIWEARL